jgi:adenine phosphoribosyltransferase
MVGYTLALPGFFSMVHLHNSFGANYSQASYLFIAAALGAGFIPARKPDKLPPETNSASYSLEYGEDHLHIAHGDLAGKQILIHDDLLATGGTVGALAKLVRQAGASAVGAVFLSEIPALGGRGSLEPLAVRSVVQFTD